MTPRERQLAAEAMKRTTDKLVELGYATSVMVKDTAGTTQILWTPRGELLKKELQLIHRAVIDGRGDDGWADGWALIGFFLEAQSPPSGSGSSPP